MPTDSENLIRIIIVFGIVSLLVGLMAVEGLGVSPFQAFSDTLTEGIVFPEFVDPFAGNILSFALWPDEHLSETGADFTGCEEATSYTCVNVLNDSSYVTFDAVLEDVNWNMTDLPSTDFYVTAVVSTIRCRASDSVVTVGLFVAFGVENGEFRCNPGDDFELVNSAHNIFDPETAWSDLEATSIDVRVLNITSGTVDVSFVTLAVFSNSNTPCAGNWFENTGCQIGRFVDTLVKGFIWILNGISFVVVSIVAVFAFTGEVIATFIFGFVSIVAWALTIPAPSPVREIIALFFIGSMAFVIFLVVKVVRGVGLTP